MPFQQVPNTAQFRVQFLLNAVPVEFEIYMTRNSPFTHADLDDHASMVHDWVKTEVLPLVTSSMIFEEVQSRGLHSAADVFHAVPCTTGCTGGASATPSLPGSVAAVVKHLTALTGRSFRGRTYWPGLVESQVSGNFISQTTADLISQAFDDLKDTIEAFDGDTQLSVVSRVSGGVPRVTAVTSRIVGSICQTLVGTRRSRLR